MTVFYSSTFDGSNLPKVMKDLAEALGRVGVEDRRLLFCVRELADNAIYHSGRNGGWCMAQDAEDVISVTVQDRGVGIHHSIRGACPDLDERSALMAAFGMGVSGAFDDPDRGLGLGLVLEFTRSGAHLLLETGGLAFLGIDGKNQVIGKSTQRVQGVAATVSFPLPAGELEAELQGTGSVLL